MASHLDAPDDQASDDEPIIEIPIDGSLDLHTFSPRELKDLIPDYITACLEKEIFELRIIHGKGQGALRRSVQALLSRDTRVVEFRLADESGGGWGATLVRLRRP